jgi:hypothetical protein
MLFVSVVVEEEVVVLIRKTQEHSFEIMVVKAVEEAIIAFKAFYQNFQAQFRLLLVRRELLEPTTLVIPLSPPMVVTVGLRHSIQISVWPRVVWVERELKPLLRPLQR